MTSRREPDWSDGEFHTLLAHPHLKAEGFSALLPGRTAGAIEVVREGICRYHRGEANALLSRVMLQELAAKKGLHTCGACGALF